MDVYIFPPRSESWNSYACMAYPMQGTPKAVSAVCWEPRVRDWSDGKQQPNLSYSATGALESHHMLWDARQSELEKASYYVNKESFSPLNHSIHMISKVYSSNSESQLYLSLHKVC